MKDLEFGWVAGFLEGEGSFACYQHHKGHRTLGIQAPQVQKEPLERLVQYTGVGKIYGPYEKSGTKQPICYWRLFGPRARRLMETLRPLMSPKRQAEIDKALSKYQARRLEDKRAKARMGAAARWGRRDHPAQLRLAPPG